MQTSESINATCPECRGPLSLERTDDLVQITCLVGHTYSPRALLYAHNEAEEKALWAAAVALRETTELVNSLRGCFPAEVSERLQRQVEKKQHQSAIVEEIIENLETFEP